MNAVSFVGRAVLRAPRFIGCAALCALLCVSIMQPVSAGESAAVANVAAAGVDEAAAKANRVAVQAGTASPRIPDSLALADEYRVQPGDILVVSVWKEEDLQAEVLVRSDGGLSFPLVGDVAARGKTVSALRTEFTDRLKRFIPNPVVSVATKAIGGNRIYVLGKVARPGEFPFVRPLDVMQALSLAGGTTSFAAINDIVILHRENGQLKAIPFRYGEVERGKDLAQNIVLQSGDTVVVP